MSYIANHINAANRNRSAIKAIVPVGLKSSPGSEFLSIEIQIRFSAAISNFPDSVLHPVKACTSLLAGKC